jgi:hypothetical protein
VDAEATRGTCKPETVVSGEGVMILVPRGMLLAEARRA